MSSSGNIGQQVKNNETNSLKSGTTASTVATQENVGEVKEPVVKESEAEGEVTNPVNKKEGEGNGSGEEEKAEDTGMTIEELNKQINETIKGLKDKLQEVKFDELTENMPIESVCEKISNQNLLGEFDKKLYKTLNTFFDDESYKAINVGPDKNIPLRVRGNLSQLVYSKIINGKMEDPLWPSDDQKKCLKSH